ncbi:PTS sugar transporter subunit IIB [Gelria sp. Kuro-4]|mgnify:FL=1|jgi:PTS system ascorbate-specific IIB component|uniref:PTS sugar transporter subunit IIB n=1 Tax=Gelria sp. Kuro-4 TaxID=2796927 RepID=UPI001BEDD896|nr:PTS sugar transporter subunit IIB [Gelria sp. Kuro-4]BCV24831.1 PTS lactose transporter subunit IIB [Gelria sp. Kuro-4]
MKIVTVCGMGFGTSLMLKMTIDDILKEEGIKASTEACDVGSAKGKQADIVVASRDIGKHLANSFPKVVLINNLTDKAEIRAKLLGELPR